MTENFQVHSNAVVKKARKTRQERASAAETRHVANWEAVYAYALKLADGDPTRVVVTSKGEVIVKNRGRS